MNDDRRSAAIRARGGGLLGKGIAAKDGDRTTALRHMVLIPQLGLCNRLRAIASARRICNLVGATCTVVWDWGSPEAIFAPGQGIEWAEGVPEEARSYVRVSHRPIGSTRTVSVDANAGLIVSSCFAFRAREEERRDDGNEVAPWLLRPSDAVVRKVGSFVSSSFSGRMVGMHIRRTDVLARNASPDESFVAEGELLVAGSTKIFLATDDKKVERLMCERFAGSIVVYPKRAELERRWPREFRLEDTIDDMVDLLLLASCEYVIGSFGSSFSEVASMYNGSKDCTVLERHRAGTPPARIAMPSRRAPPRSRK